MSPCLRERTLWELHHGAAGSPGTTAHLATCSGCAARYARLGRDLALIGEALQDPPAVTAEMRRSSGGRPRRVAIAASLVAVLALAGAHAWRQSAAPRPGGPASADSLVFLDEVSVTLWSPDGGAISDLADPANAPDGEAPDAGDDTLSGLSTDRGGARSGF
jgi:hypothetical protein